MMLHPRRSTALAAATFLLVTGLLSTACTPSAMPARTSEAVLPGAPARDAGPAAATPARDAGPVAVTAAHAPGPAAATPAGNTSRAPAHQPTSSSREHVAAGALRGRTGAYLTVRDPASRVRLALATLPGLLYRISTPANSGLAPAVSSRNGRIQATFRPTGGDGPDDVRIVLNEAVRWAIRLPAGAGEQQLDLARGRVTRLDLGASGLVDLRLPDPAGTVPVTFTDSVGTVAMTATPTAPMRVRLTHGAGVISTPWQNRLASGTATVLQDATWPTARHRYTVLARSRVGVLTVRHTAATPR